MNLQSSNRLCRLVSVAVVAITAVAMSNVAAAQGIPAGKAAFRLLNLSPDAGALDLIVDGNPVAQNVEFDKVSDYVTIDLDKRAKHNLYIVPTGESETAAIFTVEDEGRTDEQASIFVVTGSVADKTIKVADVLDNVTNLSDDTAHIKFVHLIEDGPAVQILSEGKEFVEQLEPEASVSTTSKAGSYSFQIVPAGETKAVVDFEVELVAKVNYVFFIALVNEKAQVVAVATDSITLESIDGSSASDGTPAADGTPVADSTSVPDSTEAAPTSADGASTPASVTEKNARSVSPKASIEFATAFMDFIVKKEWGNAYGVIGNTQLAAFGGSADGMQKLFASKTWDKITDYKLTDAKEDASSTRVAGTATVAGKTMKLEIVITLVSTGIQVISFSIS